MNVKKVSIVYINNEYIRESELELDKLFKIDDVTLEVLKKQTEIKSNIEFFNEFMEANDSEPVKDIGMHCFKPYDCAFWDYCTRDLPKPNVFDIAGMFKSKKLEKYYDGKISFEDYMSANHDKINSNENLKEFFDNLVNEKYQDIDKSNLTIIRKVKYQNDEEIDRVIKQNKKARN